MKIRIELDRQITEEEVVIRCSELSDQVRAVQKVVADILTGKQKLCFFKNETEYYLPIESILFYETDGNVINAHTNTDIYQTKYKLYELEEILPGNFMRISKSAILNVDMIFSITKGISSCLVQFQNSHKQVYVSRNYVKALKNKLDEKRK